MKLLHTSDWHLGAMDHVRSLKEDQEFFVDQIGKIVQEKQVDAVMIAGDVYDRSVASAEAVKLYDGAMTALCKELGVPVLLIAGNHDSAERLATCSTLLASSGLLICGALTREPSVVSFDDTDVYLLPWITEAKVKSVFPEKAEEIESIEDAYRVVTDTMRDTFDPHKRHIVLAHAFITNSETSTSDRAAEIGFATQVSASVFEGFDYVALGHLHKPQDVTDTVRYSGTPMPYSFGREETHEKSVTIVDTATMEREIVPLTLLHRRATLTGTLAELLHPTCDEDVKNGFVWAKVTDEVVGNFVREQLEEVYPNLLEVSGQIFGSENVAVSMTAEELEKFQSTPVEVFRQYCCDVMDMEADEHLCALFEAAVAAYEEQEASK